MSRKTKRTSNNSYTVDNEGRMSLTRRVNFQQPQPSLLQKKVRVEIEPRTKTQREYLQKLEDDTKDIIIAIGPAGTGKTHLSVLYGIRLLQEEKIKKIIITRPAVSADESLGFLPGDLNSKMEPWTRPIFDIFSEYYNQGTIKKFLAEGVLEICPFAYMRGRTFSDSFIIADEIQLTTPNQFKMLTSRIGENSKMIINGDLNQADRGKNNGLSDFCNRIFPILPLKHIDIVCFGNEDIVRHPAVKEILAIYGE